MEDIALTLRIVSSVFYKMEFHFHKTLSRTAGNALFDNLFFLAQQFLITIKNDMACRGQITVKDKSCIRVEAAALSIGGRGAIKP